MNSRQKGKRGELTLVNRRKEYGFNVRRSQQYAGINHDADVVGIDGLHIECKYTANGHGSTYEWLEQAVRDKREEEVPVVIHRKVSKNNRGNDWLVTMSLDDFVKLWKGEENGSNREGTGRNQTV